MSYVKQPDSYYQNSIGPYGTPGWQFAPVPGWGINPLFSARYPRVATNGLGAAPSFNLNSVKGQQQALNYVQNAGLTEDGYWGNNTRNAVVAFQKKYGLTADGSVGPQTIGKLQEVILAMAASNDVPEPTKVTPVPDSDIVVNNGGATPAPGGGTTPAAASGSSTTTYLIIGGVVVAAAAAYFLMKK
jgi:peptidoglycan hydrolase-like protein with peptidoglycan-binding domain